FAAGAVAYMAIVVRRARRQTEYTAVIEDWLFHAVFPLFAYLAIAAAALTLPRAPEPSLFVLAGSGMLLMFVGIHNAWDPIADVVISGLDRRQRARAARIEKREEGA